MHYWHYNDSKPIYYQEVYVMIKVKILNLTGFFETVNQCKGRVSMLTLTPDGDKVNITRQYSVQEKLAEHGVSAVDGILMDLGVSSPQFDEGERGFSYRFDAPLDMRMDQGQRLSAWHVINEYPFEDLCRILKRYGEEPFAKQIARAVERRRAQRPIDTTFELVEVIRSALPAKVLSKKGHPAKRTFQAVRMEVNSELQELEAALQQGLELLRVGGRMCVISFHSLEDRMVKEAFVRVSRPAKVDKRLPLLDEEEPCFNMISRKPITAAEAELQENNRSHSAKLRIIEKVREQHG